MGINAQTSVPKFTIGDVLTAANTNLLTNAPPVFSGTATRDAAFGGAGEKTLAEGQLCYLEDSDVVQFYSGSSWNTVGASGLVPIVPTSVSVGGGSATFNSVTGKITATTATTNLSINGLFTSTYQNYLIQVMLTGMPTDVNLRLRVAGVDNSAGVYSNILAKAESGTGTISASVANETTSFFPSVARTSATSYMSFSNIQMSNPFSSSFQTSAIIDLIQLGNSTPLATRWFGGANLNVTTSYDGFSLLIASGSFTGNVQVFGYV